MVVNSADKFHKGSMFSMLHKNYKHKDPTNQNFWNPAYWPLEQLLEPGCGILIFTNIYIYIYIYL